MSKKEEIYDRDISPLMGQIIKIANENGINCLATFVLDADESGGVGMCTTCMPNSDPQDIKGMELIVSLARVIGARSTTFATAAKGAANA